jgi:hypothetical protein
MYLFEKVEVGVKLDRGMGIAMIRYHYDDCFDQEK